jgi:transcription antitermination factor NusG
MKKTTPRPLVQTRTRRTTPKPLTGEAASTRKWYVLCVEAGKEQKVVADLLKRAKIADLWPVLFKKAIAPVLRELTPREGDGKLVMRSSIKYEGYIFLNMTFCEGTLDIIRATRYQFGLLPHRPEKPNMPPNKMPSEAQLAEWERWVSWKPMGLASAEAAAMLLEQQATFKKRMPAPPKFRPGDVVEIIDRSSPFFKMTGPLYITADNVLGAVMKVLGVEMKVEFETWQMKVV